MVIDDRLTEQMESVIETLGDDINKTNVGTAERSAAVKDYVGAYKARLDHYQVETEIYEDCEYKKEELKIKRDEVENDRRRIEWMKPETLLKVGVVGGVTVITIVAENCGGYVSKALGGLSRLIK